MWCKPQPQVALAVQPRPQGTELKPLVSMYTDKQIALLDMAEHCGMLQWHAATGAASLLCLNSHHNGKHDPQLTTLATTATSCTSRSPPCAEANSSRTPLPQHAAKLLAQDVELPFTQHRHAKLHPQPNPQTPLPHASQPNNQKQTAALIHDISTFKGHIAAVPVQRVSCVSTRRWGRPCHGADW